MDTPLNEITFKKCDVPAPNADCSTHRPWFSPKSGIYNSKHPCLTLPDDPNIDVASFILSHKHTGVLALIDSSSGTSISYSDLRPFVESVAAKIRCTVEKGDTILIILPNSIYFPLIVLGVLYSGAIFTTMNPSSTLSEIKKQSMDSGVRAAFCMQNRSHYLREIGVSVVFEIPEESSLASQWAQSFFRKPVYESADLFWARGRGIKQQDTAAILYSSGTTGPSKGVVLSHRNFIAMVVLFVRFEASQYGNLASDNVYLATLPMFHVYGLSLFAIGLLSLGSLIVMMQRFDSDEMAAAIYRYKVTHFPLVPPLLMALTRKAGGVLGFQLESLKQVSCGAAPLSMKHIDEFNCVLPQVDLIQGYGMTESTAVGTRGFNTANIQKYSSIGLLAPCMEAKVVNSGIDMPPTCPGELWLRGPAIMGGYLNNKEATEFTVDKQGWLHTGDIVHFDEDGYLHLCSRIKEIIKYKGFQISPVDLEAVLMSHPEILDAAVLGEKDEGSGEIPVAFVVKKLGSRLSESAIIDYVASQVAAYKKVRRVVFTPRIPKSPAGKILRKELHSLLSSKI